MLLPAPTNPTPASYVGACPRCGGCLFFDWEYQVGRRLFYFLCVNCAREYPAPQLLSDTGVPESVAARRAYAVS